MMLAQAFYPVLCNHVVSSIHVQDSDIEVVLLRALWRDIWKALSSHESAVEWYFCL